MGTEIERKFRVLSDAWREQADEGKAIRQFYLAMRDDLSIRIRTFDGIRAVLTVKTGAGLSRGEYEYDVPLADAGDLEAARIGVTLEKRRHRVPLGSLAVEVDVFAGPLTGLVIAEIELPATDHLVDLPSWLGPELTHDPRFTNARLAEKGTVPT